MALRDTPAPADLPPSPWSGYPRDMTTRDHLDRMSTKELHDRAIAIAKHRLDVGFLWDLVRALPVAEEVAFVKFIERDGADAS